MGKGAPTLDDFPQTVIQRLNGVGGVDHPADLWRKTEERGQALPVPLPARHNRRIPLPPVFGKRPQRSSGGLHRRRCVDRPEIRSHPFAVFPDDKPQAVADLMHDTQLNLGVRVNRLNGFRQSPESIHAGDEAVLHPAVLQFVEDVEPEFGALGLAQPHPQQFLLTLQIDAQRQIHRLVADGTVLT